MASNDLITTPGTGTQNATQDPQAAGNSNGSGTAAAAVQPGSAGNLDNGTNGVPLANTTLPTTPIGAASATVTTPAKPLPVAHHVNQANIGMAAALFLVALVILTAIFIPVKNTTE